MKNYAKNSPVESAALKAVLNGFSSKLSYIFPKTPNILVIRDPVFITRGNTPYFNI